MTTTVSRIEGGRFLFCHGQNHSYHDWWHTTAEFIVNTGKSKHHYHRDCLPLKWRSFVGLGTVVK